MQLYQEEKTLAPVSSRKVSGIFKMTDFLEHVGTNAFSEMNQTKFYSQKLFTGKHR